MDVVEYSHYKEKDPSIRCLTKFDIRIMSKYGIFLPYEADAKDVRRFLPDVFNGHNLVIKFDSEQEAWYVYYDGSYEKESKRFSYHLVDALYYVLRWKIMNFC